MESDAMGETATEPSGAPLGAVPEAAAFTALTDLLAVIADPREHKRRLRGFHEALTAADAAQRQLLSAQSEFAVHEEKTGAQLKEREAAVRAREVAVSVAEQTVHERQADLVAQGAALRREDAILKRRIMLLARLDAPGPLQSMPSWKEIAGELFAAERLDLVDEAEVATERPDGMPAAVTLTQTFHKAGRRSARRVQAEA
jgi:hypothetical protein